MSSSPMLRSSQQQRLIINVDRRRRRMLTLCRSMPKQPLVCKRAWKNRIRPRAAMGDPADVIPAADDEEDEEDFQRECVGLMRLTC